MKYDWLNKIKKTINLEKRKRKEVLLTNCFIVLDQFTIITIILNKHNFKQNLAEPEILQKQWKTTKS